MKLRTVIDTNVLVSGLKSRHGASFRILSLVGTGVFDHCVSVGLLFEYEATLKRPGLLRGFTVRQLDDFLDYFVGSAQRLEIFYLWRPVLRDPGDDLVLEVAVTGSCSSIVTFNKRDFEQSEKFGIAVLAPQEFLAQLEKST
jgi:putative PIN family toxin of toxin-antitoxin system